ncbi:MAG: HAD family hydrolase [Deltaproteobacteria bacterium]|nr:HAD family hydrolase [Deltaproteobacteria bacterium]
MTTKDDEQAFKAVGFDLFNTLVVAEAQTLQLAMARLVERLRQNGFSLEEAAFNAHYATAAVWHIGQARESGRETHNRFWICDALNRLGNRLSPDDPRIADAVEAYFDAFYPNVRLIPGTESMLETLKQRFPLGLVSNFTHGPAARKILHVLGIDAYFSTIVISGEAGYRKPHPHVFDMLAEGLGEENRRILFVGDDPEADVHGALRSGFFPVWMTYARDGNLPFTSGIFSEGKTDPDSDIPRIASWEGLFPLLDGRF